MTSQKTTLKTYLLTGLLVLLPIAITLWVLDIVLSLMDKTLMLLPDAWQPEVLLGFHIPGIGAIISLACIFAVGVLVQNFIGQALVRTWEAFLQRIPIIGALYGSVKQVSDTLLSSDGNAFRRTVLIQYPRKGLYTIAFLTGAPSQTIEKHLPEQAVQGYVSVYVPTTPNPTSGFLLLLPRSEVIELDLTVDAALKYIVSLGVVSPSHILMHSTQDKISKENEG